MALRHGHRGNPSLPSSLEQGVVARTRACIVISPVCSLPHIHTTSHPHIHPSSTMTTLEPEELYFKLPDTTRIAAQAWGRSDGTLRVLAVHGYLDNCATFAPLARLLLPELPELRLVCIDLSGHGKSDHREPFAYGNSWILEMVEVADSMGWEKFHLMGHSAGQGTCGGCCISISDTTALLTSMRRPHRAAMCASFTGLFPQRVQSLILIEGLGPESAPPSRAVDRVLRILEDRRRNVRRSAKVYPTFEAAVERMLQAEAQLSEPSARVLARRGTERVAGGFCFSHDPRLRGSLNSIATEEQARAFIKRIVCPVLVIWGSYRWYPLNEPLLEEREKLFANLSVVRLTGNHHVHLEKPDSCLPHVKAFYDSVLASSSTSSTVTTRARL